MLVGGGHSHALVLRAFARLPEPGLRLTLIATDTHTPYSGMWPGHVAGHYSLDDCHIDLRRLCVAAGARFIHARVTGLDRTERLVALEGRPPVPYDWVSLNTGSTPDLHQVPGAAEHTLPVKPIAQLHERWQHWLSAAQQAHQPLRVAVVGAGAGGVEMLLALQHRLQRERARSAAASAPLRFTLVSGASDVLPTHAPGVRRRLRRVLEERGVACFTGDPVGRVSPSTLHLRSGAQVGFDACLWVTQAVGASWLASTGLRLDERGCVQVNAQLQSLDDERVFAAGDVASFTPGPLDKAGVFAVRMGPVLADNLRRAVLGQPLKAYRPQRRFLSLISTGDRYAVASWGGWSWAGAWVWRWKDHIDRRFMAMFSAMGPRAMAAPHLAPSRIPLDQVEQQQALSAVAMRCGGCGAKVGPDVLRRALAGLTALPRPEVLVGLDAPDDAALVALPAGAVGVHTVDFFRAFIDDPYVFGQIAANHALGDLYAMGAQPLSALATCTVPPGLNRQTEELLRQMMAGALSVLNPAQCALVGGHSGEGQELALGFALQGTLTRSAAALRKGGLQAGQVLIWTKPLGTGTLRVAQAQGQAVGRWVDAALTSMVQSSAQAAQVLREHGATACTDVTGFGLAGHLLEMTRASGVDAELQLEALPVLDGALACLRAGHLSSLHAGNRAPLAPLVAALDGPRDRIELLFDPQTAGGLLAGVPAEQASDCVAALRAAGYQQAALIGQVVDPGASEWPLRVSSATQG